MREGVIIWVDEVSFLSNDSPLWKAKVLRAYGKPSEVVGEGATAEEALGHAVYALTKMGSVVIREVHTRYIDGKNYYPEV